MIKRLLSLAVFLSATACSADARQERTGRDDQQVDRSTSGGAAEGGARVIGTIEATFEGVDRTWYVLEADVNGRQEAAAFWYEPEPGAPRAMIAGYDTPDVPFHTFGAPGSPAGDYAGSVITLIISFQPGEASRSVALPADDDTGVLYMPSAVDGPLFGIADGSLEVTSLEARRSGDGRIAGTFEGTMGVPPRFEQSFPLTGGRFEVEALRYREDLPGQAQR
jgi:hypothetical protein